MIIFSYRQSALTFQGIEKLFAGLVFKMLLKEDMISKELM